MTKQGADLSAYFDNLKRSSNHGARLPTGKTDQHEVSAAGMIVELGCEADRRTLGLVLSSDFRNVWSAAELQAETEDDSWSALMYSAFSGVKDSGP